LGIYTYEREMYMERFEFTTSGVCSRKISITIENGIVRSVDFQAGCEGNLQGISRLVEGMPVLEVIRKLKGIDCDGKGTSCPDQLAEALAKFLKAG
jgi:uncharacterized protein (TIGR03905 family)